MSGPSSGVPGSKGLHLADLETGHDLDFESMRENEGEAANYGVYFDDTEYDYMQHLRDVGEGSGEAHFIDAAPVKIKGKGKGKDKVMKLEDALRLDNSDVQSTAGTLSVWDENMSYMSATRRERTYQDQQDVPDEIAGFQPDMDPRLREVLEALEDDAYVDENDEENVFGELATSGRDNELDLDEFMMSQDDYDDEGWESDVTEKPPPAKVEVSDTSDLPKLDSLSLEEQLPDPSAEAAVAEDGDWLKEFAKYKQAAKSKPAQKPIAESESVAQAPSEMRAPSTLYTLGGTPLRKKKRKGALTNPSAYSMTSSSLARTDGQQLLDERFDRVEKLYRLEEDDEYVDDEDGGMSLASGRTGMSKMSSLSKMSGISTRSFADGPGREDMDSMMDGFLKGWEQGHPVPTKKKGKRGRKGGIGRGDDEVGVQTLDAVRQALGPAIVPKAYRA